MIPRNIFYILTGPSD